MAGKSLIEAIIRLGHLLERSDLTDHERQKYQDDFLQLTSKCLPASEFSNEQESKIALDSVLKGLRQKSSSRNSSRAAKRQLVLSE